MTYKKKLFILISLFSIFFSNQVLAQNFIQEILGRPAIVPEDCRVGDASKCEVSDFIQLFVDVFKLILGLVGSLALFFFIYGGFMWVLSRGNQQMVEKGKSIIGAAGMGIIIVFSSWIIVNFVIVVLTGGDFTEFGKIFGKNWFNP